MEYVYLYGHVSEGGPPIGWRCDIFPEKMKCQWCFQTEDDYIHIHFDLILKLNYTSLI